MKSRSFSAAISAVLLVAAIGLTAGAARAESVMKECGAEWKAAKANNTTNGQTWQEFLKSCRAQKAEAPAAAPAPAARGSPGPCGSAGARACPGRAAETCARRPAPRCRSDRGRPVHHGSRGEGPLPGRYGRLGQHQVAHLSFGRHAQLRHDQAGRLHVRGRRQRRRRPRIEEQDRQEQDGAAIRAAGRRTGAKGRPDRRQLGRLGLRSSRLAGRRVPLRGRSRSWATPLHWVRSMAQTSPRISTR